MLASPRRRLATTLLTGAGLLAAASPAAAAPVSAGSLEWHTVKQSVNPPSPEPATRTFLGYIAGRGDQFLGRGSAAPVAPATGTSIPNDTADGTVADWTFPADTTITANTFDAATRTGTIEFDGNVRFEFLPTGQTVTRAVDILNPVLELAGDTGKLYASGAAGTAADATYDRSQPVFNLNLAGATVATAGRVTTIDGIVPSVAVASRPFPSNYPVGNGPRTAPAPPVFGTFDATITEAPTVTLSKTTDIAEAGEAVTVTGSRFKATPQAAGDLDNAGLYAALVGPDFDTSSMGSPTGAVSFIPQSALAGTDGGFTRSLNLNPRFGTGESAVDCLQVACRIYVWKAHRDADPSQRVSIPVTFKKTVVEPEPTVTATPTVIPATPDAVPPVVTPTATPAATTPKLTKVKLAAKKLSFRVSEASTVTARVQRRVSKRVRKNGKVRRVYSWKTVRTVERETTKAGTFSVNPKLGKGRFRVTLRAVSAAGVKSKAVRVTRKVG